MLQKFKRVGTEVAHRAGGRAKQAAALARNRAGGKQGEEYLVALDIGTEFVKALIGRVNKEDSSLEIIGVGRAHQGLSDMQAGAISDIAGVVENCDKALNQAEEQA